MSEENTRQRDDLGGPVTCTVDLTRLPWVAAGVGEQITHYPDADGRPIAAGPEPDQTAS